MRGSRWLNPLEQSHPGSVYVWAPHPNFMDEGCLSEEKVRTTYRKDRGAGSGGGENPGALEASGGLTILLSLVLPGFLFASTHFLTSLGGGFGAIVRAHSPEEDSWKVESASCDLEQITWPLQTPITSVFPRCPPRRVVIRA